MKKNKGCAFDENYKLITVEFQPNSELVSIEKYAFADSSIECLTIPENCKQIGVFCFNNTSKFLKVEFPMHSKLEIIHKNAFCKS